MTAWPRPVSEELLARQRLHQKQHEKTALDAVRGLVKELKKPAELEHQKDRTGKTTPSSEK